MAVSEKSFLDKTDKSSLIEQLESEIQENVFDKTYSHKEDLEKLLRLAEELKDKVEYVEKDIENIKRRMPYRLLIYVMVSIGYIFILSLVTNFSFQELEFQKNFLLIPLSIVVVMFAIFTPFYFTSYTIKHLYRKAIPDRAALKEVLQLLRETSNIIAEQEKWSVLSRAEFRIRLSRFNLDETSKSGFNFFS